MMLEMTLRCQRVSPCQLGGGIALSGVYLGHRMSRDLDLVCHERAHVALLARELPELARAAGSEARIVVSSGTFVRARIGEDLELDVAVEATPDLEEPEVVEGAYVSSLADLRAAKLTCLLSRSEPRDLVDVMFLDRAGFPPEKDLALALRKNAGIDPGVLVWLLGEFPVEPLPRMLTELSPDELARFRNELRERLRRVIVPEGT